VTTSFSVSLVSSSVRDAVVRPSATHVQLTYPTADDPEFAGMKASYREHIGGASRFKQVVPIHDEATRAKIHQTYRLKYLKDAVLARILDDPTFTVLNSYIFFNEVDIVVSLRDDKTFLPDLFAIFPGPPLQQQPVIGPQLPQTADKPAAPSPPSEPTEQQRDGVLFLQQFCTMAKNLQPNHRVAFYRSLAERGLLRVIEFALSLDDDPSVRNAGIDVLMILIDHDPASVRNYCYTQHEAGTRALLVFLIDIFHTDPDLGLKAQLAEALRVLVQSGPEGMTAEVRPVTLFRSVYVLAECFPPFFSRPTLELVQTTQRWKSSCPTFTTIAQVISLSLLWNCPYISLKVSRPIVMVAHLELTGAHRLR
jgi:hypothetical protein